MDAQTLRVILNVILVLGLISVSISLLLQKMNGISKAMSLFNFCGMLAGPFMLVIIGLTDVCQNLSTRDVIRDIWNTLSVLWISSGIWLLYTLFKEK